MDAYKPLVAWLAVLLVACGGGGRDEPTSPAPAITSTPPPSARVGEQ